MASLEKIQESQSKEEIEEENERETESYPDNHQSKDSKMQQDKKTDENIPLTIENNTSNVPDNDQTLTKVASNLVESVLAEPEDYSSRPSTAPSSRTEPQEKSQKETDAAEQSKDVQRDEPFNTQNNKPLEDPFAKATKFLEKHQLLTLLQSLTADIVLKRPQDPLDFMIEEIEAIQEQDRQRKGVFLNVNKQSNDKAKNDQTGTEDFETLDT